MNENKFLNEQQNETAGFIEKAKKIMLDYSQATGCGVCIYDSDYVQYFPESEENSRFCPEKNLCLCCANVRSLQSCSEMHINAIKEAEKKGCHYIYSCKAGLLFWTSSVYIDGRFFAAVRGSGFSQAVCKADCKADCKAVDILSNANDNFVMCNSENSKEEPKKSVKSYPEADTEKIQHLAEMMQLCAESLNPGSEDYHGIIRRRTEQQETIAKIIEDLKKQYGENAKKPGYPLEMEKNLMAALRKGDSADAKKTLNELLATVFFSNQGVGSSPGEPQSAMGHFKFVQLRITELVVLISRLEISPAKNGSLSMEINSQNLKLVQEAKTIEELTDIIHTIVDRVSNTISSFRGIPHAAALRKAENFILENYTRKISLKEIAGVAGLSPPYFSTIFKEEMGENLSKYLNRLRVEKASHLLLETDMSLSEIAACCCFEDQSWFSKIFKAYTGISPGKYRIQGGGVA